MTQEGNEIPNGEADMKKMKIIPLAGLLGLALTLSGTSARLRPKRAVSLSENDRHSQRRRQA